MWEQGSNALTKPMETESSASQSSCAKNGIALQSAPFPRRPSPRPVGFAASGGNATGQLDRMVRGLGPRRNVLMAAAPSPGPAWPRERRGGPGCAAGAARPSAPRANASRTDRRTPTTRRQAVLATMGLRVCHGRSQPRHALRRSAGRRVAPRSRPPHSHRDRRRDAVANLRGDTLVMQQLPRRPGPFPPISTGENQSRTR